MRKLKLLTFLTALVLGGAGIARAQIPVESRVVDRFASGNWQIEVRFFDPAANINFMYPKFDLLDSTITARRKADMWSDYLHRSPLYLFTAFDVETGRSKHFCMRGDPEVRKSARFYKVEVVTGDAGGHFDSALVDSNRTVAETFKDFPVGGSLFEHMAAFQRTENADAIGNGVKFLGYYFRVTPYAEVKDAMLQIIEAAH